MKHTKETLKARWDAYILTGGVISINAFILKTKTPRSAIYRHTTREDHEKWIQEAHGVTVSMVEEVTSELQKQVKADLKVSVGDAWVESLNATKKIAKKVRKTFNQTIDEIIELKEHEDYAGKTLEEKLQINLAVTRIAKEVGTGLTDILKVEAASTIAPMPLTSDKLTEIAVAHKKSVEAIRDEQSKTSGKDDLIKAIEDRQARERGTA